jgi:fucose permease
MAPGTTQPGRQAAFLKALTFLMFMMFAMTTDSVGVIIPQIIRKFSLSMTAAGTFQYATMGGISLAALCLGFVADRLGRKQSIIIGLVLFGGSCALFAIGDAFAVFVVLLFAGGMGIGLFKAGALALIGDVSHSASGHTATMNTAEGFFGIGAIVGPAIVAYLLQRNAGWQWLYVIAAAMCGLLIVCAAFARYPAAPRKPPEEGRAREIARMLRDPYMLAFGAAAMLYVGTETGIYVWAPTYLAGYHGPAGWLAVYAVSIFFVLRALGRFLGARLLAIFPWGQVLAFCSCAMLGCFLVGVMGGRDIAALTLPLSGLFMSVIYPTLNSKGISCFEKARHGAAAGALLFFTCASAVLSPLAMAALSDAMGDTRYSIYLLTGFGAALAALAVFNLVAGPAARRLAARETEDYASAF